MALLSETHLRPHERFFIQIITFIGLTASWGGKIWGTAVSVRKDIPHNHVDLPTVVSTEARRVCILIGNSEMLLTAVCKSPGHVWSDADIIELLSLRHKSLLAGDLNAKCSFWDSLVSSVQGKKLLNLLDTNEFEISSK
jgi:hypothetical protein